MSKQQVTPYPSRSIRKTSLQVRMPIRRQADLLNRLRQFSVSKERDIIHYPSDVIDYAACETHASMMSSISVALVD